MLTGFLRVRSTLWNTDPSIRTSGKKAASPAGYVGEPFENSVQGEQQLSHQSSGQHLVLLQI